MHDDLDETWVSTERLGPRTGPTERADLVIIAHPDPRMIGRRYEIRPGADVVLGRSSDADISFPRVRQISRRQARLRWLLEDVVVEDLGSRNGTFVNGERIDTPTVLQSGDLVEVENVRLKLLAGDESEAGYQEAMYDLVMRDELTGAYNKRMYERSIERDYFRSLRHSRPISVVILDVDELQGANEKYGHDAGDEILRWLAELIEPQLRREEVLARVGGDEFVILCPEVGTTGATILADRLRQQITETEAEIGGRRIAVSCSFGVAERRPGMDGPNDLFDAAKAQLVAAKKAGRDKVSSLAQP